MNNFSEELRRIRREKELTQIGLDKLAGIPIGTVSQYESNNREPTLENLLKLSKALNCSFMPGQNDRLKEIIKEIEILLKELKQGL